MYTYTKEDLFGNGPGLALKEHVIYGGEPEHLHEFIEMVYIFGGSGIHRIDGVDYKVSRGDLLFINYRQVHSFRTDSEMRMCNILLDPEWISEKLIDSENAFELLTLSSFSHFQRAVDPQVALVRFSGAERSLMEGLLRSSAGELSARQIGYEILLRAQVTILLTMVFRKMSRSSVGEYERLNPDFLAYIRENCTEKLTLEELAKKCFYNSSYFSRLFKERYGVTVTEYINQSRLEKAMELLEQTDLPVEQIALRAGFGRKASFYGSFKARTGLTPQDYRNVKKRNGTEVNKCD